MKDKIDELEERVKNIQDMIGDFNDNKNIQKENVKDSLKNNEKFTTLSDAITYLQKEASENDSIHYREIYKKCNKKIYIIL
jgi:cell fate (sporulation/competence/biofilm development) regulator YmcA (YheA/YmcA/DUF963 family)